MIFELLFFLELSLVFLLSRVVSHLLSQLFFHITKKHATTIHLLSFLFLPGVIIHELSHAIMAGILFVPVGHMEFMPVVHGNHVKLGSVSIAKTDPVRRFLIGVAPVLMGILLLASSFFYLLPEFSLIHWQVLLFLYILFEVGNTMFSSRKDMEGTIALVIFVLAVAVVMFSLGLRIPEVVWDTLFSDRVVLLFQQLDIILFVLMCLDILLCGILFWMLERMR